MTKRGLGKGLDALFQSYDDFDEEVENDNVTSLNILKIDPNVEQPRRDFNQESIKELSKSIQEHGVVQPIIVKPLNGRYVIIAGERRWRAARQAGLEKIPVIIRDLDDKEMLEIALIENLQREDLNPMEEAEGINNLINTYNLNQEQVAKRLGKSRPAISNALRLLKLPKEIRILLEENSISTGHARALLGIEDNAKKVELAKLIVDKGLNVRETESIIKKMKESKEDSKKKKPKEKPSFIMEIENKMEEFLGTRVTIQQGKKKGIIEIEYYSNDDLERIIDMF